MKELRIKISEYISIKVPPDWSDDQCWQKIDEVVKANRANMGFVIDDVIIDGESQIEHPLIDETVG